MRYINIHSHTGTTEDGVIAIQSLYSGFDHIPANGFFSLGLHPWYLPHNWQSEFKCVVNKSSLKNVVAIGECGLDKITDADFELQKEVFAAHIELAIEIKKPLVIHCVKAYEEIMVMLKNFNNRIPVIFHGFNKNKALADRLLEKGYYLSFGKAVGKEKVKEYFASMPLEKIFLETDDEVRIEEVYNWAADAMNISTNSLSLQLNKNAEKVFGITSIEK